MQESARFRYHQWYVEGLATLRRELEDRAVERAAESMAALGRFEEVEERP